MIPPSYEKKKGAYKSVKSIPSILPCSLLHLPNTEDNEVTKCDLAWAGGVGPLPCRLGQSPFPSQWTRCYSMRPEALWKEALEGREHRHLSPTLSFQLCHARMGVLGSPGWGGWQLSHRVRYE